MTKIHCIYILVLFILNLGCGCLPRNKHPNKVTTMETDALAKEVLAEKFAILLPEEAESIYYSHVSLFTQSIYIRFTGIEHIAEKFIALNNLPISEFVSGENPYHGWTISPEIQKWWLPDTLKNIKGMQISITNPEVTKTWYLLCGEQGTMHNLNETMYIILIIE